MNIDNHIWLAEKIFAISQEVDVETTVDQIQSKPSMDQNSAIECNKE